MSGCTTNKKVSDKRESNASKTEVVYFDNLGAKAKKNVKFHFTQQKDETADSTNGAVYVISTKITNKTNKVVKFDRSKFLLYVSTNEKYKSNKSGKFKLSPGKSTSIHQLLGNVPEEALTNKKAEFIYLNKDNKLANVNFHIKNDTQASSSQTATPVQQSQSDANTTNDDQSNHVATGDDYDDDNPTKGWDESNLDPLHDGKRTDRILAWQEHYKQVFMDQGMSEDEAFSYVSDISYQKENEYEANH